MSTEAGGGTRTWVQPLDFPVRCSFQIPIRLCLQPSASPQPSPPVCDSECGALAALRTLPGPPAPPQPASGATC